MPDTQQQEHESDFELVVTRLPQARQTKGWPMQRRRRLRAALVVLLVGLVVLLLFVGTVGQQRMAGLRALFSPPPTATLSASEMVINVVHWAPWGTVLADGHPVLKFTLPPNTLNGAQVTVPYVTTFTLPRGHYTLDYQAAPFPPLRCHLSVPAARGDDCPLSHEDFSHASPNLLPGARVLDLRAAPEYLSPTAYAALLAAVRQMLTTAFLPMTTLQPGEHYINAQQQVATSPDYRNVTLDLVLAAGQRGAHGCAIVCAAPIEGTDYLAQNNGLYNWIGATAQVRVAYRYTDVNGQLVLDAAPISTGSYPDVSMPIVVAWDHGHWRAAFQHFELLPNLCPFALDGLNDGVPAASPGFVTARASHTLPNWIDGCIVEASNAATGGEAVPLLYRFGALLALTPQAQRAFPTLPLADAFDQQLAAQAYTG